MILFFFNLFDNVRRDDLVAWAASAPVDIVEGVVNGGDKMYSGAINMKPYEMGGGIVEWGISVISLGMAAESVLKPKPKIPTKPSPRTWVVVVDESARFVRGRPTPTEELLTALRSIDSAEAKAVAKLIKRGEIDVYWHPGGRLTLNGRTADAWFEPGTNNIHIDLLTRKKGLQYAAGKAAHETVHWLQEQAKNFRGSGVFPRGLPYESLFTQMGEYEAISWQRTIDPWLGKQTIQTDPQIWTYIERGYSHLPSR